MNENPVDSRLEALLKGSLPPADTALRRDLWPELEARLATKPVRISRPFFRLRWWEWGIATGDLALAYFAPEAIPALLYHL